MKIIIIVDIDNEHRPTVTGMADDICDEIKDYEFDDIKEITWYHASDKFKELNLISPEKFPSFEEFIDRWVK